MKTPLKLRTFWPVMAAAMSLSLGACAMEGGVPTSTSMQLGSATLAPRGYLQFCLRRPDQCGLRTPMTEIHNDALQAALNREEWTNVLSVGAPTQPVTPAPVTPAAVMPVVEPAVQLAIATPSATAMDEAPVSTEPREITSLDSATESKPMDVELQPATAPARTASGVSVSLMLRESSAAPVPVTKLATGGAPKLEQLFQDVHRVATPTTLHYNPGLWAHLEAVNNEINARIRPRTDWEAFGVDDYWTLPLDVGGRGEGNCKHYALEKRRQLIEGGMSEDVLSLAVVKTPRGETHAVLIVATDRGDFVLDNLTPEIRGWRDTGYTWLTRQTPGDPLRWASVQRGGFGG